MKPTPLRRFAGVTVLITGGASGIGRATAERLGEEGATVILADLDGSRLADTKAHLLARGTRASTVELDQRDEAAVNAVFARPDVADNVDVVCANAGVNLEEMPATETTVTQWDDLLDTNLRGAFLVARAAIPVLVKRGGGSIVFTASTSGLRAHPRSSAYAASKAGLLGLSRSLALEVAGSGIRINCVCPGAVRTPLVKAVYGADTDAVLDLAASRNPLSRVAEPEDVAAAIAFLASDDARHITATELIIDGGEAARL